MFWGAGQRKSHSCDSIQRFSGRDLFFNKRSVEQLQLDCSPDQGLLFIHGQSSLLVPKQIISTPRTPPSWHNTLRLITHNWRGGAEGLAKPLCPEDKWSVYEALGWGNNFLYISRERTKKNILLSKNIKEASKASGKHFTLQRDRKPRRQGSRWARQLKNM